MTPPSKAVEYVGKDLEAMSFAVNYHRWILDEFRPYLGKRFVEVGAGSGSFSELILEERPESLTVIEPSGMFDSLESKMSKVEGGTAIKCYRSIFESVREEISRERPDSILYVNVLEHIEDDAAELSMVYDTLVPGGRCFIFVPAMPSLYGPFDKRIGHFRRYSKPEVETLCARAGFRVLTSRYFDVVGILPWWLKYVVLSSDSLEPGAVALYDKAVVPIARVLEKFVRLPRGKNLLVIAEK